MMELSGLNGKKRPTYGDVFDSYARGWYHRTCLQTIGVGTQYYMGEYWATFWNGFIDQRKKHAQALERSVFLYYPKEVVIGD